MASPSPAGQPQAEPREEGQLDQAEGHVASQLEVAPQEPQEGLVEHQHGRGQAHPEGEDGHPGRAPAERDEPGERAGATRAQTAPRTTPAAPARSRAAPIRAPSRPGWRGSSPIMSVPSPSIPSVPRSIMAEIAALAAPTSEGRDWRAATPQKR